MKFLLTIDDRVSDLISIMLGILTIIIIISVFIVGIIILTPIRILTVGHGRNKELFFQDWFIFKRAMLLVLKVTYLFCKLLVSNYSQNKSTIRLARVLIRKF